MPSAQKKRRSYDLPPELQGERILTMQEVYDLSGLSPDTWRLRYPHLVIRLSPRRQGVKLKHVLELGQTPAA